VLASAVRGVAATSNDPDLQDSIVDHARDVMDKSANLIEESKKAVQNPQNPDNQTRLAQVCNRVALSLTRLVSSHAFNMYLRACCSKMPNDNL